MRKISERETVQKVRLKYREGKRKTRDEREETPRRKIEIEREGKKEKE